MKTKLLFPITIIIGLFLLSSLSYSQSGWLPSNTGTNFNYYSIHFTDSWIGWACGENGKIIKTLNGGDMWQQQSSGTGSDLNCVFPVSNLDVIACGNNGTVIKTVTGGDFWNARQSGTNANLKSVFFISPYTGWICGDGGTILKTTNSGNNWSSQQSGVSVNLNSIYFTSANSGWAVGATGKILKTTNGGSTWAINVDLGTIANLYSVCFPSAGTGYISGEYSTGPGNKFVFFYKTITDGEWWLYQFSGVTNTMRSVFFTDSNRGWAAGDSGVILGTTNGGENWIGLPGHTVNNLYSVSFTSPMQGWVCGNSGTVLKTVTSGFFDTLNTNRRDLGVIPLVINSNQVPTAKYRIMFRAPDTSYNIIRSLNNGASFDTIISHVSLHDTGRVFDGLMIRVEKIRWSGSQAAGNYVGNVGVVQDPVFPPDSIQTKLYGWDYFPPQNCYLEGSKNISNHERLWQSKSMSISYPTRNTYLGFKSLLNPEELRKVKIIFTGYGQGQMAYRYLYFDQIHLTYMDMKEIPIKVYEVDETDSTLQPRQLNCAFLEYPDSLGGHKDGKWEPTADSLGGREVLYIFNSNYDPNPNPFYTTKNLLLNQPQIDILYVWSPKLISPGLSYHINDEFYIYPYTVTRPDIAPGYPLYYEFQTYSLIGVQNISNEVPSSYSLLQNYPNPFNPKTKIKFSIPKAGLNGYTDVTIKVYDILGREVTELVNEKLRPGTYETEFDGTNFSSGIYFYMLRVGNYFETKKMVLLK